MGDLIVVHPDFDGVWPFAADHFRTLWPEADFVRLAHGDERPLGTVVEDPSRVTRLATLGVPVSLTCCDFLRPCRKRPFRGLMAGG